MRFRRTTKTRGFLGPKKLRFLWNLGVLFRQRDSKLCFECAHFGFAKIGPFVKGWACGLVVMTAALHAAGRRFDSAQAHSFAVIRIGKGKRINSVRAFFL